MLGPRSGLTRLCILCRTAACCCRSSGEKSRVSLISVRSCSSAINYLTQEFYKKIIWNSILLLSVKYFIIFEHFKSSVRVTVSRRRCDALCYVLNIKYFWSKIFLNFLSIIFASCYCGCGVVSLLAGGWWWCRVVSLAGCCRLGRTSGKKRRVWRHFVSIQDSLSSSSSPHLPSLSLCGSGRHAAPRQLNLGGKMCRRDVLSIAGARPMGSLIFCWVLGRGSGPPANKDIFSGPSPGGARDWRHRGSPGTIHSTHCI